MKSVLYLPVVPGHFSGLFEVNLLGQDEVPVVGHSIDDGYFMHNHSQGCGLILPAEAFLPELQEFGGW